MFRSRECSVAKAPVIGDTMLYCARFSGALVDELRSAANAITGLLLRAPVKLYFTTAVMMALFRFE